MKNLKIESILFSLLVMMAVAILITSCGQEEILTEEAESTHIQSLLSKYNSLEDVKQLDIDKTFSLSEESYDNFLNSLVFIDEQLVGFHYGEIDNLLDDEDMQKFWSNFGVNMELSPELPMELREDDCALLNYRPLFHGCFYDRGWVCLLSCHLHYQ